MTQSRREVLIGAAALAAGTISADLHNDAARADDGQPAIVDTSTGKVRGTPMPDVSSFLGIPYGSAKRFMPPEPAAPWTGVRDAVAFGPRAPQFTPKPEMMPPSMKGIARFAFEPTSEDCLVLNVWTPKADGRKRPVMFWCHGGGFYTGSGQEPDYYGANLARKNDVVVVTVNHRLNVFGYGYLGHIDAQRFGNSGNVGMLDLAQALAWVKTNIGRFGGDAGNVTIFGQSGGGSKVSYLLAMPAAKGLFHRAIIMSGPGVHATERAKAEETMNTFLGRLGVTNTEIEKLLSLPADKLVEATGSALSNNQLNFSPVVDGIVLPTQPWDPVAPEVSATIPLIIGHTRDELGTMMVPDLVANKMTDADLAQKVQGIVGAERGAGLIAGYKKLRPNATPVQIWVDIATDQHMGMDSNRIAERKVQQGRAPVHMYLVAWETPILNGVLRATHGEDMALVFDNVEPARGFLGPGPAPQQMADMMSRAWVAFARTGNPEHGGIPKWPAYTLETRETLVFAVPPKLASDPQAGERALWSNA